MQNTSDTLTKKTPFGTLQATSREQDYGNSIDYCIDVDYVSDKPSSDKPEQFQTCIEQDGDDGSIHIAIFTDPAEADPTVEVYFDKDKNIYAVKIKNCEVNPIVNDKLERM